MSIIKSTYKYSIIGIRLRNIDYKLLPSTTDDATATAHKKTTLRQESI